MPPTPPDETLTGEIFEEGTVLSAHQFKAMVAVEDRRIAEWIEEGVITVLRVDAAEWSFDGAQVRRARIALRLEHDLGVNAAGIALALELLEELELLRRHRRTGRS